MGYVYLSPDELARYQLERVRLETLLTNLDTCLDAFVANPVTSYMLNTGQTTQQVTKSNLGEIEAWRGRVFAQLMAILRMLNDVDGATVYVRPGF